MLIPTLRRSLFVAVPLSFLSLLAVACSDKADGSEVGGGNGNGAGTTGAGSQPSLGDPNNPNGSGGSGSNGGVTVITPGSECASSSGTADAVPAVVQMVVDISGSMDWAPGTMGDPPRGQQSKWDITSAALKDAVAKLPANIAVGVNFFPNNPGRNDDCIRNRVDVPINLLGAANSMQRRAFDRAIDNATPADGTPTHAAFNFGLETLQKSTLEGRKFILLITDGVPTWTLECKGAPPPATAGQDPVENGPLIAAVEAAYAGGSGPSTFVIGSPGSEDARGDLSQMATKGGTATAGCSDSGPNYCHLDMTTATDFAAALSAGLAQVAGQISTCEYVIPADPKGLTLDPRKVNVLYTHGDGTESSIGKGDPANCESGWKYDDENAPTKIILCGSDCDGVKGDLGAKIDVIFGCATIPDVPVK